jgi:hypothetical protein
MIGAEGIDHDHSLKTLPGVHQRNTFAALLICVDSENPQTARHHHTGCIVATIEVAAAYDARLHCYTRSTCSRRKWVAQEIQGS